MVSIHWRAVTLPEQDLMARAAKNRALDAMICRESRQANRWFGRPGPSRVLLVCLAALLALSPVLLEAGTQRLVQFAEAWASA